MHPSRALGEFTGAMKVEAVYRRSDGRQGTVIVSFGTASEAKAAFSGVQEIGGVEGECCEGLQCKDYTE